jgi:Fe-Mn family superoxide dismutase
MPFELPPLPYALDALAPHISKETLEYHHGKHHKAYVDKLNSLIPSTPFEHLSLEEIILQAGEIISKSANAPDRLTQSIFNNAAQVWNHTFYWDCMSPNGGGEMADSDALTSICQAFGSLEAFKEKFTEAAINQFASGWAWLVKSAAGKLEIVTTSNAGNPMTAGQTPLLVCDVWEHAYYIDTRNSRPNYMENFWKVVNWDFVAKNTGL